MGNQDDGTEKPRRRLRIPAALAVAFVGTSASAAMMFAGCSTQTTPNPVDAGQVVVGAARRWRRQRKQCRHRCDDRRRADNRRRAGAAAGCTQAAGRRVYAAARRAPYVMTPKRPGRVASKASGQTAGLARRMRMAHCVGQVLRWCPSIASSVRSAPPSSRLVRTSRSSVAMVRWRGYPARARIRARGHRVCRRAAKPRRKSSRISRRSPVPLGDRVSVIDELLGLLAKAGAVERATGRDARRSASTSSSASPVRSRRVTRRRCSGRSCAEVTPSKWR